MQRYFNKNHRTHLDLLGIPRFWGEKQTNTEYTGSLGYNSVFRVFKYAQTTQFRYLGGLVNEDGELTQEINHRSRAAWACIRRFSRELFDRPRAPWRLKVRLLRAEAMEALLYGCMTWAPRREHYRLLRRTHHRLLLRVIGYRRERGTYR